MQLGPYELLQEIGRGGAGVVYRARGPRGLVALKLLPGPRDEQQAARFERERRLLAAFGEEEGFVPLEDAGSAPEGLYLVSPLVAGGTLRARLERGPLSFEAVSALGRALGAALGAAHARGVLHRDVKPENVIFTGEGATPDSWGRPLLLDLGIAKHYRRDLPGGAESRSLTEAGALHGTIAYMSPEQARGAGEAALGPSSDVFSLGVLLYECLTGRTPFAMPTVYETLMRIESGSFTRASELRPGVPLALERAIARALERAPGARFADGAAFARALEGGEAKPAASRRLLALSALVALALALSGLGALGARPRPRAAQTPESAPGRDGGAKGPEAPRAKSLDLAALERLLAARPTDLPTARAAAEEACRLEPTSGAAWAARAWVRILEGEDLARAEEEAERALALDAKVTRGWLARGAARLLRDPGAALSDVERALALAPEDPWALEMRGHARFATGDLPGADSDAERLLARDGRDARAWALRGRVRLAQNDAAGAQDAFSRGIDLAAGALGAEAWADRAEARRRLNDLDGALQDADHAVQLEPRSGDAWMARGAAHFTRREFEAADQDLARGLELAPRSLAAWRKRAATKLFLGDEAAAIRCAQAALELEPEDVFARVVRGTARAMIGELEGALEDAAAVLRADGRSSAALAIRAEVARRRGDPGRALPDLDRALAKEPTEVFALTARGEARAALGELEGAFQDLDLACKVEKHRAWPFRARGLLRARLGRPGAREDLERALALLPKGRDDEAVRAALAKLGPQGDGASGR